MTSWACSMSAPARARTNATVNPTIDAVEERGADALPPAAATNGSRSAADGGARAAGRDRWASGRGALDVPGGEVAAASAAWCRAVRCRRRLRARRTPRTRRRAGAGPERVADRARPSIVPGRPARVPPVLVARHGSLLSRSGRTARHGDTGGGSRRPTPANGRSGGDILISFWICHRAGLHSHHPPRRAVRPPPGRRGAQARPRRPRGRRAEEGPRRRPRRALRRPGLAGRPRRAAHARGRGARRAAAPDRRRAGRPRPRRRPPRVPPRGRAGRPHPGPGRRRCCRSTRTPVLALAEEGRLPGRRIGVEWRFARAAVVAWLSGPTTTRREGGTGPDRTRAYDAGVAPAFRIMGIVNVTPDSFSDGGEWFERDAAIAHGRGLVRGGREHPRRRRRVDAAVRRPGLRRRGARARHPGDRARSRDTGAQLSIDTMKLEVARDAIAAGATYVNDVTAFRHDPALAGLVAEHGCDCCLMHMLGDPRDDAGRPALRRRRLRGQGVPRGARGVRRAPRASPRSASPSTPASASARRSSTTSSCCAASTRSSRSASPCWSARRARRSSAGSPAARTRTTASPRRSRRTCSRSSAARACSASTTSPPTADALTVAAATLRADGA